MLANLTRVSLLSCNTNFLRFQASNEFFYQFPNCLAYSNLDEAVEMLVHALKSKPEPLADVHSHALSWEGATERLYTAAAVTELEMKEWCESGVLAEAERAARFHVESGLKSRFVKNLFSGKVLAQSLSSLSNKKE